MGYLSLYMDFVAIKFKSMAEYPAAFIMTTISKMLGFGSATCVTFIMIYRFGSVMSWSMYEVLLLFGMNTIAYGLSGFFMFHPFTKLSQHIRNGTFDEMLTKPLNPFFYLCSKEFSTGYFANVAVGTITIIVCFVKLGIQLSFLNVLYLIIVLLGAGMIHSGFFMFANVPSFWLLKVDALAHLRHTLEAFIRYPVSIYDTWIGVMLTFVFPYAFINFFPAQYFLNKRDLMIFPAAFVYITPVVGLAMVLLGYAFFNFGMKFYKSTGS